MKHAVCTLYVLTFAFATVASADTLDARFSRANNAFGQGDFARAIALYEDLEAAGVSDPDVELDAALASASAGELGRARLHFERARRLRPRDAEIENGLGRVLDKLAERTRGSAGIARDRSVVEAYGRQLSVDTWARLFAVLDVFLFLSLALAVFAKREAVRASAWISSAVAAALTVASAVGWAGRTGFFEDGRAAIALSASPLRTTPSGSESGTATMATGDLVSALESFGAFTRVRTSSGAEGWVDKAQVVAIDPE